MPFSACAAGGAGLSFDEWYEEFRREAVENGVSAQILDSAFFDVKLVPAVISFDRKQPEFRQDIVLFKHHLTPPCLLIIIYMKTLSLQTISYFGGMHSGSGLIKMDRQQAAFC